MKTIISLIRGVSLLFLLIFSTSLFIPSSAQEAEVKQTPAAIVVQGKRLFAVFTNHEGLSPSQRVARASEVLRQLAADPRFDVSTIRTADSAEGTDILASDKKIVTITNGDAKAAEGETPSVLAREYAGKIRMALAQRIQASTGESMTMGIALTAGLTIILIVVFIAIARLASFLCTRVREWEGVRLKGIKIQKAELLGAKSLTELVLSIIKLGQFALFIAIFIVYIYQVLVFFPQTRSLAQAVVANATVPIADIGGEALAYLPSLLVLLAITGFAYALISFSSFFFTAISDRSITLADFDPDWGEPTFKIIRFLIIAVALMIALPYMPGWESPAFKQMGLILGILISLGSTGAVAHVIAGTVLTYTNAFKTGERIKIGDVTGDVVEKTLFVTRIITPKNEVVSIPNGNVLSSHIINYSHQGKRGKLILYTSVTIGYEVPWKKVHELLISAAVDCTDILSEPSPFVLQTALNDFHVSYELNAFTSNPMEMPRIYSELHQEIRDKFDAANVEIMSPHYTSLRDGNQVTIPASYLPKDYQSSGFKISS